MFWGAITKFWQSLVNWIKECISELASKIKGIIKGVTAQIKKIKRLFTEFLEEITTYFSRLGTKWLETTKTRAIKEEEVPEHILKRFKENPEQTIDISDDLENVLKLKN